MAQPQLFMDLAAHPQAILDAMDGMRATIEGIERQQKTTSLIINIVRWLVLIAGIAGGILSKNLLFVVVAVILIILSAILYRRKKIPPKSRFEAAYRIAHTLRDDVGRKGLLVGRLDFSQPDEKTKLLRTGTTSHGNPKYYYRDPWFTARLKLVDGNVVKLLLEDRVKVKKGAWVYHQTSFENKVTINPDLYKATSGYDPSQPHILIGSGQMDPKNIKVEGVLENLRGIYSQVRPIQPAGPPPTFDAAPPAETG